jgi:hypothetical protein
MEDRVSGHLAAGPFRASPHRTLLAARKWRNSERRQAPYSDITRNLVLSFQWVEAL